jgi:hypothetical protein
MSNKHLGHTARKRFGQNFLFDDYVIDKIVSAINPQKGQSPTTLISCECLATFLIIFLHH